MVNRLVSVDSNYNFPTEVQTRLNAAFALSQRPQSLPADFQLEAAYDALRQLYNVRPGQLRGLRRKLARILSGTAERLKVLTIGDSNTEGDGAVKALTSLPAHLHKLVVGAGVPDAGTGLVFARVDTRWTRGDWATAGTSKHGYVSASTAPLHFISDKAGTNIDYWYDGTSGAHTILIDGVSSHTPPTTANKIEKHTISGLGNTRHSVTVYPAAAGVKTYGVEVYKSTGFSVTNAGISGTSTEQWKPTATGDDNALKVAAAWAPDVVYVNLGTNDQGNGVTLASFKANLQAIIEYFPAADVIVGTPIPRSTDLSAYVAGIYEVAASLGVPLVDLNDRWFPYADAYAAGYYSDTLHGNAWSFLDLARAVADLAGLPTGTQTPEAPAPIPEVGTLLVGDTFNRADGALGTTETGALAWTVYAGTAAISGNQLLFSSATASGAMGCRAYVSTAVSDCAVLGTAIPSAAGGWGIGLTFRQNRTAFTGWTVEAYDGTVYKLIKHTDANTKVDVATSTKTTSPGDRLRVELNGDSITVKCNGLTIMTATDSFNATAVEHGFVGRGGSRKADDFEIRTLA